MDNGVRRVSIVYRLLSLCPTGLRSEVKNLFAVEPLITFQSSRRRGYFRNQRPVAEGVWEEAGWEGQKEMGRPQASG